MNHGLYNTFISISFPWPMGYTTWQSPMTHGPYNVVQQTKGIDLPWVMGCTTLSSPMTHGLYNTFLSHDPWVVQHFWAPWPMGCIWVRVSNKSVNTSSGHVMICFIPRLSLIVQLILFQCHSSQLAITFCLSLPFLPSSIEQPFLFLPS